MSMGRRVFNDSSNWEKLRQIGISGLVRNKLTTWGHCRGVGNTGANGEHKQTFGDIKSGGDYQWQRRNRRSHLGIFETMGLLLVASGEHYWKGRDDRDEGARWRRTDLEIDI